MDCDSNRNVAITAVGGYLPERVIDNQYFVERMDTTDEWIRSRSGVVERRYAAEDETTSDMAVEAAKEMLEMRGIGAEELGLIIIGTVTPDHVYPSTGNLVQYKLGATDVPSFDILAACTGYVYALAQGYSMVRSGMYDKVMVIGAEKMQCILNHADRASCFLFGDAAAGFLLEASDEPGILEFDLGSDGSKWPILHQKAGGSAYPMTVERLNNLDHLMHMEGREVFKHAVRRMAETSEKVLKKTGWTTDDIDIFFSHQANIRIINSTVKHLKLPAEKSYVTIDKVGNTTAASIPYGVYKAFKEGRLKKGDKVLFAAFGGGFTWGSGTLVWQI